MVKVKNKTITPSWKQLDPAPASFRELFPEYPGWFSDMLYQRGLRGEREVERFLNPRYPDDLHDPFALSSMEAAVKTIQASIKAGERIVVHGDYDADGLTAAALLADALGQLGAQVDTFVPSRYEEGYGVASATLAQLHADGAGLVITVDCGISDAVSIAEARAQGLPVIVTDHHVPPAELPDAEAVINPNVPGDEYPNKSLTGVGVAFKVAQALFARSGWSSERQEKAEKWLLDLVAVGTVADMAELRGENRALVQYGLLVLKRGRRLGLDALMRAAGVDRQTCSGETLGYAIAPRLNAPGRVSHARDALQLLTTTDSSEAARLAMILEQANRERQQLTLSAVAGAREQLVGRREEERLIFIDGDWKSGVVGLVAGRLVREYARPAIVVERGEEVSRGSVRSVPAFHVAEALQAHGDLLDSFGGHAQAGGFTVKTERLELFRERLQAFAQESVSVEALQPELALNATLPAGDVTLDIFTYLERLEPFGAANPMPRFRLEGVRVEESAAVGAGDAHLKLRLVLENGTAISAIGFGLGERLGEVGQRTIDIAGRPSINRWNGTNRLEWHVEDFRSR